MTQSLPHSDKACRRHSTIGQLAQAELGLDYYVARFYDPLTGHFTQADSIIPEPGKASAFDRYAYVLNNPIRYSDPSGHWEIPSSWRIDFNLSRRITDVFQYFGIESTDITQAIDSVSLGLDSVSLAIDSTIATGDIVAGAIGFTCGAAISLPDGGTTAPITGIPGTLLGVGLFEANPLVRGATVLSNSISSFSTMLTGASDLISGETNIGFSLEKTKKTISFESFINVGRDTMTSEVLTTAGWASPIGVISAPLQYAAVKNDKDELYIGPLKKVKKSFRLGWNFRMKKEEEEENGNY